MRARFTIKDRLSMRLVASVWVSLILPPLAGGVIVAGGFWALADHPTAAWFTLVGTLVATLVSTAVTSISARAAGTCLHRGDRQAVRFCGVYQPLLQEALSLIGNWQNQAEAAKQTKTELEARALVRQRQIHQLESALNCLTEPVIVTDARDHILFLNTAAGPLLRHEDEHPQNSHNPAQADLKAIPELARLLEVTRTRSAATNQRKAEFEREVDGETRTYRVRATNVYDQEGTLSGVVTVLEDICEEQEAKTRHAEFVSSVCHELKTPMTGIKSFTEMLMDGDVGDPEEQREIYEFIDMQVDRLTRLVNNMLNLTRIESGVIKVQREDCELNAVLKGALEVVEPMAEQKQIRLISQLSELYLAVHIDTDLFGQAIVNLLSNAVKYTPEGGEVRLRSRMHEDQAVIEVRDTGMGIPEDSLPHIFDRFYRVPQNNKAALGTGLGLALVHYIVTELHNGQVTVDSAVNEGTCFTMTIPRGHLDSVPKGHKRETCTV